MTPLRRALIVSAVAVVVGFSIDRVADATHRVIDLTADESLTLSRQSQTLARAVPARTDITVFLAPDDPERAPAAALLLRYQRLNPKIHYRILDPRESFGEQRRLGIDPGLGGVAVARESAVEVVPTITEQDITGALARLARGRSAELCFTAGHGEASIIDEGPEGLKGAASLLEQNGYRLQTIDLLATPSIPEECDGVVVANPTTALGDAASVLTRWLEDDGRMLLLTDPVSSVDLNPLVRGHQLGLRRGIVLEGDPQSALPQDPTSPIVRAYSSANPIVRRLAPTFFPGIQQVVVGKSDPSDGLTVSRLADTSRLSYLETEPLTSVFDPAVDTQGPITIAAAASRTRQEAGEVRGSRAVVVGDVDFASNALLGEAANSAFLVRSLDWLTLDDQLIVLSANIPRLRELVLTKARITYARFVSLAVLPGLFLLGAAAVWAVRRGR